MLLGGFKCSLMAQDSRDKTGAAGAWGRGAGGEPADGMGCSRGQGILTAPSRASENFPPCAGPRGPELSCCLPRTEGSAGLSPRPLTPWGPRTPPAFQGTNWHVSGSWCLKSFLNSFCKNAWARAGPLHTPARHHPQGSVATSSSWIQMGVTLPGQGGGSSQLPGPWLPSFHPLAFLFSLPYRFLWKEDPSLTERK